MDVFTIMLVIAMAVLCCVFAYFIYVFLLGRNIKVAKHASVSQAKPDKTDTQEAILRDVTATQSSQDIPHADREEIIDSVVFSALSDIDDEETTVKKWDEEKQRFVIIKYNRSFTARLIQSKDETKRFYSFLKNEMLSYNYVKSKISWKHETFKIGKEVVAKMRIKGKTLCLYLALNPQDYAESKYKIEDVSDNASNADTPCLYRIVNQRRCDYSKYLIGAVMAKYDVAKGENRNEDYVQLYPYENRDALLQRGLVKTVIQDEAKGKVFGKKVLVE